MREKLLFGLLVLDPFPACDLLLGNSDVLENLGTFDQPLVLRDVDQDRGSPSMLRQQNGSMRGLDLLNEGGGIRPEFGYGTNIFAESDRQHLSVSGMVY
jgi:hypothetical protein